MIKNVDRFVSASAGSTSANFKCDPRDILGSIEAAIEAEKVSFMMARKAAERMFGIDTVKRGIEGGIEGLAMSDGPFFSCLRRSCAETIRQIKIGIALNWADDGLEELTA